MSGAVYARKQLHMPTATCSRCDFHVVDEEPDKTRRKVRKHVAETAHTVWVDPNTTWVYEYHSDVMDGQP